MKLIKIVIAYFILFVIIPTVAIAGWTFTSPMPHARYGHDATLGPDGKIYVMGGFVWYLHDGRYSNIVYDPLKNVWNILSPVPGWVRADKRLCMILDPETNTWDWVKKIDGQKDKYETFDSSTNTWKVETIAVSPHRIRNTNLLRQGDGVANVTGKDGRIYWIGGTGQWTGFGESIVLPYDPVSDRWPETTRQRIHYSPSAYGDKTIYQTDMSPMNERRIDHEAVTTADGAIFVMGGRQWQRFEDDHGNVKRGEHIVLNTVERYDPESNRWEYRKAMTKKRFLFAAVVGPDNKIYTFGGSDTVSSKVSGSAFDTTEVYDPATDEWSSRTPMPNPSSSHAAVLCADGKIYVLGGNHGSDAPPVQDVFIYDPVKDSWEEGPQMNLPRSTLAAVATPDGKIYAIGGTDVGAYNKRKKLNIFLPKKNELYTGKVQDTVEVLDVFN